MRPTFYTQAWKRVIDVIPLKVDLTQLLQPGETFSLSNVSSAVSVFAGYDSNPSIILYGGPLVDINNSKGFIQTVQEGLDGVIYLITFTVLTSTNRIISQFLYLAVLDNGLQPYAPIIPFYYTSQPYPIEYSEQLKVSITPNAISMLLNPRYAEQLKVSISPVSFSLTVALVIYSNYIPEQLKVSINPTSFTLTLGLIVYSNYIPEQLKVAILPNAFTLTQGLVTYSMQPEQLKVSISPVGFTLT